MQLIANAMMIEQSEDEVSGTDEEEGSENEVIDEIEHNSSSEIEASDEDNHKTKLDFRSICTMNPSKQVILKPEDVPGAVLQESVQVADHSNLQLQRWLECRSLKKTGTKAELVQRVINCIQAGREDCIFLGIDNVDGTKTTEFDKWNQRSTLKVKLDVKKTKKHTIQVVQQIAHMANTRVKVRKP
ncbi:hypothetical protein RN001_006476 [Aquatica leii]|uniref:SAP domain-containing protein n=1 Tax=Aquatica leii TaxID=1421715 RepID=A0AAN7SIL7_9COLE|nr:hypothetical protein RN001_006476 [Aquatica leii]